MSDRRPIPSNLRALFVGIARTALASSGITGCVMAHELQATDAGEPGANDPGSSNDASADLPDWRDATPPHETAAPAAPDAAPEASIPAPDAAPKTPRGDTQDAGDHAGWDPVPCQANVAEPRGPLKLSRSVEYLGIYADQPFTPNGLFPPEDPRTRTEVARFGTACTNGSDGAACQRQLEAMNASHGCGERTSCTFAVVGAGGNYTRLDSSEELLALLGDIDAPAEAVLLAAYYQKELCPGPTSRLLRTVGAEVQQEPSGSFVLRITRELCRTAFQDHYGLAIRGGGYTHVEMGTVPMCHSLNQSPHP